MEATNTKNPDADRIKAILEEVKPLAAEYYLLTSKPLGVTGEVAEYLAAQLLGLDLAPARTLGYDAIRHDESGPVRVQIKGRAFGDGASHSQRLGKIKADAPCDTVMLVLLDNASLDVREIWEAPFQAVAERLAVPGSKARERGTLSVAEFLRVAKQVWPGSASRSDQLPANEGKVCPECGYRFKGITWGGIDGHWRTQHEHIMPYHDARRLILSGCYARTSG